MAALSDIYARSVSGRDADRMPDYSAIEQRVIDHFRSRPDTLDVVPPVNDPVMHVRDMVWRRRDGEFMIRDHHVILEFDDDMRSRDAFYFEVRKVRDPPVEGFLFRAQGAYLAYVSTLDMKLYFMPLPELRDWVMDHRDCLMVKEKSSNDNPENRFYRSIGYLVPRTVLKRRFRKVEMVELDAV